LWQDRILRGPNMNKHKLWLLLINLVGGSAVLGSYAWGLDSRPDAASLLWGGVPLAIRPLYTASMLTAALGYFAFSIFILIKVNPAQARVWRNAGFGAFHVLYAAILLPSAAWMPMTLAALMAGTDACAWAVRILLAWIGLASLGLLYALFTLEPVRSKAGHRLALLGALLFCFQTVVLDAVVWAAYFRA
jgi:hypothetical protein